MSVIEPCLKRHIDKHVLRGAMKIIIKEERTFLTRFQYLKVSLLQKEFSFSPVKKKELFNSRLNQTCYSLEQKMETNLGEVP
jgi:hypothetical protein